VRTLTFHPDRPHPLQTSVEALAYRFDDPAALANSLHGVKTLYNTYWVRFDHGETSFSQAIERSATLFAAAREAGVERIVHVSITNPSLSSALPYFRGKAVVEQELARAGTRYSIVRPTLVFGGERDVLVNNIAWILRRTPIFAMPGGGDYPVQPVHVEDLARICVEAAEEGSAALEAAAPGGDVTIDAAGPETMSFVELVVLIRRATGGHARILNVPAPIMALAAGALGLLLRDVVLTQEEIDGLMAGLLVSHDPPLGRIRFSEWVGENALSLGRRYANELQRHFATRS
jgi:uncharacterized protein YbjT (DUF2867 family)